MAPRAIISYDDTPGDHDALMLGRIRADAGAWLTLAYVRHATQSEPAQELREEQKKRRNGEGTQRSRRRHLGGKRYTRRGRQRCQ